MRNSDPGANTGAKITAERVILDPARLSGLTWAGVFGDANPVELEIGTGKAGFLLNRARAHPEINFLGIEWANEFFRYAVDRMRRWNVPNVRMLRTDASRFIREFCPRASLSVLHVYHPDPWPKRRHHRRRLFQPEWLAAASACLVPGGRLAIQTDHEEYFQWICALLAERDELVPVPFDAPQFGVQEGRLATNFEAKYIAAGRTIHRLAVVRSAAESPRPT